MRRHNAAYIKEFIQDHQVSSSWMARQLKISSRQIKRIRLGPPMGSIWVNSATWKQFKKLLKRIEGGFVPPSAQELAAENLERNHEKIQKNLPQAKLTPAKVREIRRLVKEGVPQKDLAKKYRVLPTTISHVINRRNWKNI